MREYDTEPIRGLPEELPAGERILWQGAPSWTGLAIRAFHARAVGLYFALLLAWIVGSQYSEGVMTVASVTGVAAKIVPVAIAVVALLALLAYVTARTTVYTITNQRIVLRFGIALPMTMNIPFSLVQAADLKPYADGSGEIALSLSAQDRQSLVVLWPHVRPWRTIKPQPMLRCVPSAQAVASTLSRAMQAFAAEHGTLLVSTHQPAAAERDFAPASEPAAA